MRPSAERESCLTDERPGSRPVVEDEFVVNVEAEESAVLARRGDEDFVLPRILRRVVARPARGERVGGEGPPEHAEVDVLLVARQGGRALQFIVLEIVRAQAHVAAVRGGLEVGRPGHLRERWDAAVVVDLCRRAEPVAYAFEETDRGERLHARAPAADWNGGVRVRADDRDRLNLLRVEREEAPVVLQKHHPFARGFECDLTAPLVEAWDGEVCLVAFEPAEAYGRA